MTIKVTDLAVGQRLPERKFEVARAEVLRYAAASGDFNPLHLDDAAAQSAGMQGAFAHGMFSTGRLATALTDALGVQSLVRLAVRFRAQAWLGSTLTSEIVVTDVKHDAERALVYLDCCVRSGDSVTISGTAVVTSSPGAGGAGDPAAPPAPSATSLLGKRLTPAVICIEQGPVQFFATAVGDNNLAYRSARAAEAVGIDGIPVPPTFIFSAAHWGTFTDYQPQAPENSSTLAELTTLLRDGRTGVVLHGEQEFEYHAPLRVGETLNAEGFVESIEEKPGTAERPGMTVMVVRSNYRNGAADLVTSTRATFLFRPATRG